MRTAEIFNGNTLITVTEGSKFRLNGVWTWDIGTSITFNVRQGVDVIAIVRSKDGSGSELEVVSINATDDLAEMSVEAKDVEVEIVEDTEVKEDTEVEYFDKLAIKKSKFTKKDMVAYIEEHNLDVDISLSKANLVAALEALNLIEYV